MIEMNTDTQQYRVVVNHEGQYSLWPQGKENSIGWRDAGLTGTKEQCLAYIREVWIDMRPLSLRMVMMQNICSVGQLPVHQCRRKESLAV
ncbi:MAG TPA: MbtH family NRPS accessory protein [Burkholderiaceae bacterium]|jgi:MbtH protein